MMTADPELFPKIQPVGETALLFEFDEGLSPFINLRVHALDTRMKDNPCQGVKEWVPAFSSMLIIYDPLVVETSVVQSWLEECFGRLIEEKAGESKKVIIPVVYGGKSGPDLAFVAAFHHLSPEEVVRRHTAQVYRVGMMGFTPGFAYLLGLDTSLATPRLKTPRTLVPAGSVGIAGGQTGIYPLESPGGWQLIGRTEITLFDSENLPYFLLSPGDEIQFLAVNQRRF